MGAMHTSKHIISRMPSIQTLLTFEGVNRKPDAAEEKHQKLMMSDQQKLIRTKQIKHGRVRKMT